MALPRRAWRVDHVRTWKMARCNRGSAIHLFPPYGDARTYTAWDWASVERDFQFPFSHHGYSDGTAEPRRPAQIARIAQPARWYQPSAGRKCHASYVRLSAQEWSRNR